MDAISNIVTFWSGHMSQLGCINHRKMKMSVRRKSKQGRQTNNSNDQTKEKCKLSNLVTKP